MDHHRHTIRLKDFDYSESGYYFITICTKDREYLFGDIVDERMNLNQLGNIIGEFWQNIPNHFSAVELNKFVVMPNHIHGIIHIVGVQNFEPLQANTYQHIIPGSIGSIIRSFKSEVTKYNRRNNNKQTTWQRNFWEHVIRNEREYYQIQKYIKDNPKNWDKDKLCNK